MTTIIFKILLIILIAAPVIAFSLYIYSKMIAFIRERNNVEKARLARDRIETGKEAKARTEERKAKKRSDENRRKNKKERRK